MKKYLIILLLFIPFIFAASIQDMQKAVIANKNTAAGSCDDCSGTLQFAWHMEDNDSTPDVTVGTLCGCADTDEIGAETGSPVFNTDLKSDGSYSLDIDGATECYTFDETIDIDGIKITFDIYIEAFPTSGYTSIIAANVDGNNYLSIVLDDLAGGTLRVLYAGQGDAQTLIKTPTTGAWMSCEYQIASGVDGVDHYLLCSGLAADEDDDDIVAPTSNPTSITFGDCGLHSGDGAGNYHLDNVKIRPQDRY